jgi:hypothetical protein
VRRRACTLGVGLAVSLSLAAPAGAQAREPRLQLSIGGLWEGGSAFGTQAATETRNQVGGDRYTLFETSTEVEAAGGLEARLTYWVTREIGAELGGAWSTPRLVTRISGDAEGAPDLSATVDVSQYVIDAAAVVRLRRLALAGGRVEPFLTAGVGYLRQVYDGNGLIETGTSYHAGGGALLWLQPIGRGWLKRVGARADARWTRHNGGLAFGENGHRTFGALGVGAVLQF